MIKAIETTYKGYRFRSRLEARWAVFFDTIGSQWEYEKEGYDLSAAGWYLPDFYLPETESFIEVKPKPSSFRSNQRLYLAGKFTGGSGKNTPDDWREGLVFLKRHFYGSHQDLPLSGWEDSYCGFSYTGPFPVDLASGHAAYVGHFEDFSFEDRPSLYYDDRRPSKNEVVRSAHVRFDNDRIGVMQKCLAQIDSADVVFAWIESHDCYGTLAEIGYAKAKGKQVVVGVNEDLAGGELWFAQSMADICIKAKDAKHAFYLAFPMSDEEKKAQALARQIRLDENGRYSWRKSRNMVGIVYGDPSDHLLSLFSGDEAFIRYCDLSLRWGDKPGISLLISNYNQLGFDQASNAARSARFEHGEKPYGK